MAEGPFTSHSELKKSGLAKKKKKNSCERSTVIINFPSLIQRGVLLIYKQYKKKVLKVSEAVVPLYY